MIDLDRRLIAPLEASESALTQTDWFLHEDSATALAAIDVARTGGLFPGRDLATRAHWRLSPRTLGIIETGLSLCKRYEICIYQARHSYVL